LVKKKHEKVVFFPFLRNQHVYEINELKKLWLYILLAATAAEKLSIGTALIINRSSCIIQGYDNKLRLRNFLNQPSAKISISHDIPCVEA